ncbi:nucleoside-diphosphate sugar epimerase [Flavobacterium akiainvivens]|uniref:Nucleoside-diphosphate sugar epimerase n=1 Tax=Flavobacterium akiainvivens TaxID=1202724 RepID=A0A0M8MC11_9FLAO|nr:NAD(P)H-binding protein [Flavobacterium akiainvivens]KOS06985.1 nucleoside-diphosphate sugar epimerase [Flavobacterium akiainvivens]SFQ59555.1 NAD(P)H-binding [Flavobacterium akiainvivens]
MAKTAIILGATGATGSELLKLLLDDNRYSALKLFSRSASGISHPKVQEHVVNLFELEKETAAFKADEVYCCIGTTKAKTPDKDTYYKIDHGIPVAAAKLAKQNGIETFVVVSAIGANPNSGIFYVCTKGEMERDILAQGIPKTHLLQPSQIVAERSDRRVMEKIAVGVMKLVNPLLKGGLRKYRSITAHNIAKAMVKLANTNHSQDRIPSDKIQELADGYTGKWMP